LIEPVPGIAGAGFCLNTIDTIYLDKQDAQGTTQNPVYQ
jgi:hypothetical protein